MEYGDLPNLLWAATGYRLPKLTEYQQFGKLRNQIVHFAIPNVDLTREVLRFCIEIMEPILHEFWKESAIPCAEDWDEVIVADGYLEEQLIEGKITIADCVKERLRRDP